MESTFIIFGFDWSKNKNKNDAKHILRKKKLILTQIKGSGLQVFVKTDIILLQNIHTHK